MLHIQHVTADDINRLVNISRETFYDTFYAENTPEDMQQFLDSNLSEEALHKELLDSANAFFFALQGDQLLGYCKLSEADLPELLQDKNAIEIARIYVSKHALGKGVGKFLMQHCMEVAKDRSKTCIWLGVWEHNHRAIQFYSQWGFTKFSEHKFVLGNDVQNDWLMCKLLKA
ncbi:MAG: GNAT family N-acetyltransferase [Bacteroidota bacterium]|nr:GNAT family N-acetyltransferase [Bacteroidota bacterium]